MNELISKAIQAVGGSQAKLAREIGCSSVLVHQMLHGRRAVSPRLCLPIETSTGGVVTRYELRPDVFGTHPAAPAIPPEMPVADPHPCQQCGEDMGDRHRSARFCADCAAARMRDCQARLRSRRRAEVVDDSERTAEHCTSLQTVAASG